MRRIAITGGIAEGKSTVVGYLADLGYSVESSDRIAREVFETEPVQRILADLTGESPPFSRDSLRERLNSVDFRRTLNAVMHPLILEGLRLTRAQVIEVPLLLETCMQSEFDCIWIVTCGAEEQVRRLCARLGDERSAEALIRTQLATRAKIPFADRLVRTNCEESTVQRFVSTAAHHDLR